MRSSILIILQILTFLESSMDHEEKPLSADDLGISENLFKNMLALMQQEDLIRPIAGPDDDYTVQITLKGMEYLDGANRKEIQEN